MKIRQLLTKIVICISLALSFCTLSFYANGMAIAPAAASINNTSVYQYKTPHSADGIGKFYLGREIAQVMGHQGAGWLERSNRNVEEGADQLIADLDLKPTDVIADIGAGTGYFSFRIAPLLTEGKVLAVDVQPEMIEILQLFQQEKKIANVEPILGNVDNPHLPTASIDLALLVDAYHEFDYPQEMMQNIVQALKPDGRVVLAEYKGENPFIAIKKLHKMTQAQVKKEMATARLTWVETKSNLPQQHLMFFRKP